MESAFIGIQRHRLLTDGEGVTTLVAFHGCPLNCRYCLNPQCNTPSGIKEILTPQQLYDKVKKDDIYFLVTGGGITFGGGEPLLQCDFINEFRKICGNKWKIYLETSLNISISHIKPLVDIIDYWIVDIKDWNSDIYVNYTGCSNKQVKENLKYLISKGCTDKIMVRVPNIPEYNNESDISFTIAELNKLGIKNIDQFEYAKNIESIHQKNKFPPKNGVNSGKFRCEVLKRIRTHVATCNGIIYEPHECEHKVCATGCCPVCEQELAYVTIEYYKSCQN